MKISVILGTRPEAIKLSPIITALKKEDGVVCHVCSTGQHREMLDQVLDVFGIKPDTDLHLMKTNQTLASLTAKALQALDKYLIVEKPDFVLVQGDTTTAFSASLAAFYLKIPVAHVEAGLRTGNINSPWPEEANRILTTRLAALHFAPTETNKINLLREGINKDRIFVTGNTVIDALFLALEKVRKVPPRINDLPNFLQPGTTGSRVVLITGHRRENFGQGFENICHAIVQLAREFSDVHFVYPVHLNPNVREPVNRILGTQHGEFTNDQLGINNIHIIEPLPYLSFVALLERAYLILTDSGGIQEEAPSLGKPILVMRDTTERPEGVIAGTVKLVGTSAGKINYETTQLLNNSNLYMSMQQAYNPYGDGKAAERIVKIILNESVI